MQENENYGTYYITGLTPSYLVHTPENNNLNNLIMIIHYLP